MAHEQMTDYEAVLADMEAKKAALETAINAIRQVLNLGANASVGAMSTARSGDPSQIPDDAFFGLSIGEAAKKYLGMVKKKQSSREIADALDRGGLPHSSGDFVNTVSTMLRRHAQKDPDLARVGRGDWGLAVWYGNRRPTQKNAPKAKRRTRSAGPPAGREAGGRPAEAPSSTVMAEQILREHGGSLTVSELLAEIKRKFGRDVPKDTLVGNLSRKVKANEMSRPAPSTYALVG